MLKWIYSIVMGIAFSIAYWSVAGWSLPGIDSPLVSYRWRQCDYSGEHPSSSGY